MIFTPLSKIYPKYGSSWGKVIPILHNGGHKVIAVQLPLNSLADDVATVKRAIDLISGPVILVGHSHGGFVITNAVCLFGWQ